MLNPFPDLLVYGIFAPLIIRLAIGALLFYAAVHHYRERKEIAHLLFPLVGKLSRISIPLLVTIEIATAASLIVGMYTQIAALVAIVLSLKLLAVRGKITSLVPFSRSTYFLLIVMGVSLLFTGGGAFGFDLIGL